MPEKIFTQEEKDKALRKAAACLAFGGGKPTEQMKQDALDVLEGNKTTEQVIGELKERYAK